MDVRAVSVRFARDMLYVVLNDGREIGLALKKIKWLKWLARDSETTHQVDD